MHFNAPVNFFLLEVTRNKVRDTDILWQKLSKLRSNKLPGGY